VVGIEDLDVADGLDVAGGDARALLAQTMRLGPSACILMAISLMLSTMSVTSSRTPGSTRIRAARRRSARGHGGALQRRQQHAAQRIAERQAEAALQRLGDDGGDAARCVVARFRSSLFGLDQFLPVLLNHVSHPFPATIQSCPTFDGLFRARAAVPAYRLRRGALARAAAIVRDRRHVADRGDGEARQPAARAAPIRGPNPDRRLRLRACACRVPAPSWRTSSAATCAANGVDLREPLKPSCRPTTRQWCCPARR
jgi:hypothetical protein